MHRSTTVCLLSLLAWTASFGRSQQYGFLKARDPLTEISQMASAELGPDAYITNVVFAPIDYQGTSMEFDILNGEATGWLYRCYSPGTDSFAYYLAVRALPGPLQVVRLSVDTVSRLLPLNVGTEPLVEPWIDSPDALTASRAAGADGYLSLHPDARVDLATAFVNLLASETIPAGEFWYLHYTDTDESMTCLIRADDGTAYSCVSSNAPKIVSHPVTVARVDEPYIYDVDATGSPSPTYSLTTHPQEMRIDSISGVIQWTPSAIQNGIQDVRVDAMNSRGSTEQDFQIFVQAAAAPPKITSNPPDEAKANETYLYTIGATGSPAPHFRLTVSPPGMNIDSGRGTIVWTPTRAQAGSHDVGIRAYNIAGIDSQLYRITVFTSPKFQGISNQSATVGTRFSLQVVADGVPAPSFHFQSAPTGMTIDTTSGTIEWTPDADAVGDHTVTIEARNRVGSAFSTFTVHVDDLQEATAPTEKNFRLNEIYPNPVLNGVARVRFHTSGASWYRVVVRNALAEIVTEEITGNTDGNDTESLVHFPPLPSGVYIIDVRTRFGECSSRCVILQ